jgi:hypothetical protein
MSGAMSPDSLVEYNLEKIWIGSKIQMRHMSSSATQEEMALMVQTTKLPEVSDKAAAMANVFSYNDALNEADGLATKVREDLLRTISMARAWFAVQKGGKWYVAPAKYAGFAGMTPDHYAENRIGISGTRGEMALKQIAGNSHVEPTHAAFQALTALAARFDRKPNTLAYVYILHEESKVEQEASLPILVTAASEAVVNLAANLPPEGVAALKRRLAAL